MVSTGSTDEGGSTERVGESVATGESPVREKPGRYQRSPAGMVGALVVTLLVISAFVAFRALNRTDLDVKPERVDYLAQVRFAQQDAQGGRSDLVYPAGLPTGWYATKVSFSSGGAEPEISLSMLTADGGYVGFVQSPVSTSQLLTTYVDAHPAAGAPAHVGDAIASRWSTWTDAGGDTALVAEHGKDSLLVFGTVSRDQLERLAASLTTATIPD